MLPPHPTPRRAAGCVQGLPSRPPRAMCALAEDSEPSVLVAPSSLPVFLLHGVHRGAKTAEATSQHGGECVQTWTFALGKMRRYQASPCDPLPSLDCLGGVDLTGGLHLRLTSAAATLLGIIHAAMIPTRVKGLSDHIYSSAQQSAYFKSSALFPERTVYPSSAGSSTN